MDKCVGHGVDTNLRWHLDAPFALLTEHTLQRRDDCRHAEPGSVNVGAGKIKEFRPKA
jgi:hypothetical protein